MLPSSVSSLGLPEPPAGKRGWPWDPVNKMSIPGDWPRVTIITPSYNQGRFIERTLRSIHAQGYPNLEHIVIDGGSTDETVSILKKYERWLDYWVSEKDRGQTHAINKGLIRATGEILNWINSDDILYPGALFIVAAIWRRSQAHLVIGGSVDVDLEGRITKKNYPKLHKDPLWAMAYWETVIPQPSTFMSRTLIDSVGPLSEKMNLRMDWEYYLRAAAKLRENFKIAKTKEYLSEILHHPDCKSMKSAIGFRNEAMLVWRDLAPQLNLQWKLRIGWWLAWFRAMIFIEKAEEKRTKPFLLLVSVMARPWLWPFRFTWGALRKAFSGSSPTVFRSER